MERIRKKNNISISTFSVVSAISASVVKQQLKVILEEIVYAVFSLIYTHSLSIIPMLSLRDTKLLTEAEGNLRENENNYKNKIVV